MRTHYDNLHVSEKASPEVIKAAYKALSQKWHPDKHPDQREKAERYFKIISQAFELLSDPAARARYDVWLAEQRSTAESIPEAEPAAEPPKRNQQQNMAEAREDGRRSRELGFKATDCPYSGDLAGEWQKGYAAAKPAAGISSSDNSNVKTAINLLWAMLAIGVVKSWFFLGDTPPSDFTFNLVIIVMTLAFIVFLITKIAAAKAWARNTYLILFIIGLPYSFTGSQINILLAYIQIALQVFALILLFTSSARQHFKARADASS